MCLIVEAGAQKTELFLIVENGIEQPIVDEVNDDSGQHTLSLVRHPADDQAHEGGWNETLHEQSVPCQNVKQPE